MIIASGRREVWAEAADGIIPNWISEGGKKVVSHLHLNSCDTSANAGIQTGLAETK